ncbi:MAG: ZIP family metal transporter [Candidatus Pacearchaeota archaeon]|jgi:zinc and cadmium transporter
MNILILIIVSTIIVSLITFVGIFTLILKKKNLNNFLKVLVSLSAGALIGGAFFHLIPEASNDLTLERTMLFVLIGFVLFFLIEKVLHWRHCHKGNCEVHSFAHISLFGDGIHNFIDGLLIASSFLVDIHIGWITTLAIIIHEVPQEFGDFGVLVYGGFEKRKALFYNFISGLLAVLGGIFGYLIFSITEFNFAFLLAIAAGGFLYISSSDLIPEIRKETSLKKALINFLIFLAGLVLMYFLRFVGI